MEDYGLVEADFQQYYNIDIGSYISNKTGGFLRYCRLFSNLPKESRVIAKYAPGADWSYTESALSLVLHNLELIMTAYGNAHRKKGTAARQAPKVEDRYLPEQIRTLENEVREQEKRKKEVTTTEATDLANFWKRRNPEATYTK